MSNSKQGDTEQLTKLLNDLDTGSITGKPTGIQVAVLSPAQVSVSQIKAAILKHPEHPIAREYAQAIANLREDAKVIVDRTDLRALLENKERIIKEEIRTEDGVPRAYQIKSLGASLNQKAQPVQEV